MTKTQKDFVKFLRDHATTLAQDGMNMTAADYRRSAELIEGLAADLERAVKRAHDAESTIERAAFVLRGGS
jgi:DNA polymerase/3'-5' exonuclease PolX